MASLQPSKKPTRIWQISFKQVTMEVGLNSASILLRTESCVLPVYKEDWEIGLYTLHLRIQKHRENASEGATVCHNLLIWQPHQFLNLNWLLLLGLYMAMLSSKCPSWLRSLKSALGDSGFTQANQESVKYFSVLNIQLSSQTEN